MSKNFVPHNKESQTNKILFRVFIGIIIACFAAVAIFFSIAFFNTVTTNNSTEANAEEYDFDELKQTYPDIVAWLKIQDSIIDFPVVQSKSSDFYYLNHSAQQKDDFNGAIYIQMKNSESFTDPVTMIYGHNMIDNKMFSTLHNFENTDYFNAHSKMYINIPGHKLTYTIASAYVYDDRHILNSFDLSNVEVRKQYFDIVMNPPSLVKHVREGVTLSEDSKIIQLSTCMSNESQSNQRYLVTGVLVNDEEV